MPQDDPILSAVKRARGRVQAPAPDPLLNAVRVQRAALTPDTTLGPEGIRANDTDAVNRYLREADSLSRITPPSGRPTRDMRTGEVVGAPKPKVSTHEQRRRFGRQPTKLDVVLETGRDIAKMVGQGAVGMADLGRVLSPSPIQQGLNVGQQLSRGEPVLGEQKRAALGALTFPYEAVKHTREVTQRALAGEDVSPGEIATAWSEGAFGLAGPLEIGAGMLKRGRPRPSAGPRPAPQPTRPTVPYELDLVEHPELTPRPAELDALIQQQQAELQAGIAGPAERPGKVPAQNPLSELDDNIARQRADIETLDAELKARRARETEPDKLRELPDEALGETPAPEKSAAATQESRIPAIAERILEQERRSDRRIRDEVNQPRRLIREGVSAERLGIKEPRQGPYDRREGGVPERRKGQQAFGGEERRLGEQAAQARAELERQGFMGMGKESMTPEDLAQTRLIGEPSESTRLQELLDEATRRLKARKGKPVELPGKVAGVILPPEEVSGYARKLREELTEKVNKARAEQGLPPTEPYEPPARRPGESMQDYAARVRAEAAAPPSPARVAGEIKPREPAPPEAPPPSGAERLDEYYRSPEVQERIERQREPEDVRTPGTRPGKMPPLPERKPTFNDEGTLNPIDFSGPDAQLEALRAERERLQAEADALPGPRYESSPERARRMRGEEKAARAKLPKRGEYAAEARSLKATIRQAKRTLERFPESDKREIAVQRRNEALQTQLAAEMRLAEVEALRKGTPYKRPPLKGKQGPDMPYGPEGGFLNLGASTKKAAPLSPAEARVDAQIAREQLAPRTPFWDKFWHWPMSKMFETAHVERVLERRVGSTGRKLPITQKASYWIKAALDSPKRIAGALRGRGPGYFDDAGAWRDMGVGSLEDALKPIRGNPTELAKLERLLIAEHNDAMLAAGRETGISPADAAEIIRTASPRTQLIAAKVRAWLNATGEAAVEGGALSRGLWNYLREKYPWYVPAERAFEGEGAVPSSGGRLGRGRGGGTRPPLRRARKGGKQPIVTPFETIPDYGARMIRYTDLHRAIRSTLDLVTENRDVLGDLAVRLKDEPLPKVGAEAALGELLSDRALRLEGDQVRIYNARTNSIETWKMEPLVADFINGLTSKEWDFATELLGAGKKGVQAGVTTYNPFFWLANFIRDNLGRATVSEATKFPFQRPLRRMDVPRYHTMGGGFGVSQESGGFMESLRGAQPGRGRLRAKQRARARTARSLTGTSSLPTRTLRGLDEWFKDAGAAFEEITRSAEYEAQKSMGLSDLEAYVHSQERLGNFAEHGTAGWVRWLDHVTPFLNPAKQGLRAFAEGAKARPGATALKGIATITIPTLALYALNYDDQDIQDLRQGPGGYNSYFLRDPRYYLRVRGNIGPPEWADIKTIFRMPKPFLPGNVFGTMPEHALDAARDQDEHGLRRILDDVGNELWQGSINPVFGVPIALGRNKALGTGVPIVPEEQKSFLPEEQIGTRPNYTLQNLSRMLPGRARFSPARAQYALGQFGGTAGRELPNLMDILTQAERLPERRGFADVPGVSRFFARTPTSAAAPIRDVYDDSRKGIQIMETIKGLTANGDVQGVLRVLDEHGDELARAGEGKAYTQALSQLADAAEFFANSEHLTPAERRDYRDEMLRLETELARLFHGALHERR